jgi:hypothetical protein
VKFAYNAARALGIEHTPLFEANFTFSLEEPHDLLLNMQLPIPVSQDALKLRLLQELHALVRLVLQMHKDEMQACSQPSTAPHFVRGDKVTVITKNLFSVDSLTGSCAIDNSDIYIRGADWETELHIETSSDNLFTSSVVSHQQSKTIPYNFSSACCPNDCLIRRRK